jgi:hypothetical protein
MKKEMKEVQAHCKNNASECSFIKDISDKNVCWECKEKRIGQGMCVWSTYTDQVCPALRGKERR